jgi:hypothetical protein
LKNGRKEKKSVGIRIIVNIGAFIFAVAIVLMAITYHPTSMQPEDYRQQYGISRTADQPESQDPRLEYQRFDGRRRFRSGNIAIHVRHGRSRSETRKDRRRDFRSLA